LEGDKRALETKLDDALARAHGAEERYNRLVQDRDRERERGSEQGRSQGLRGSPVTVGGVRGSGDVARLKVRCAAVLLNAIL
jgi:hypothetical protein